MEFRNLWFTVLCFEVWANLGFTELWFQGSELWRSSLSSGRVERAHGSLVDVANGFAFTDRVQGFGV